MAAACDNDTLNNILTSIESSIPESNNLKKLVNFLKNQTIPELNDSKKLLISKLINSGVSLPTEQTQYNLIQNCFISANKGNVCDVKLLIFLKKMNLGALVLIIDNILGGNTGEGYLRHLINTNPKIKDFFTIQSGLQGIEDDNTLGLDPNEFTAPLLDVLNPDTYSKPNNSAAAGAGAGNDSYIPDSAAAAVGGDAYDRVFSQPIAPAAPLLNNYLNKFTGYTIANYDANVYGVEIQSNNIEPTNNLLKSVIEIIRYASEPSKFNMNFKIYLYTIVYILLKLFYFKEDNKGLYRLFASITRGNKKCAPKSIQETITAIDIANFGGYNNKNGNIDYYLCKCNFKQSFKKVSAKSSREAAKMVAMKVLKGNKKIVKFSLKRMVGKKEKCYDYEGSIDKKGKIIIKNQ